MELRSDAAGQRQQQPIKCLGTSRSCHADSIWPRALQGPFSYFSLSLSLTIVSQRCPLPSRKIQTTSQI